MSRVAGKVFKKIIFSFLVTVFIFLVSGTIAIYLYKDRLIDHFIQEANKSLNTPVDVGHMDVSMLTQFPRISILMDDVVIKDSYPDHVNDLLTAERMAFSFSPLEAITGEIVIDAVSIKNGVCTMYTAANGEINYRIFKPVADTTRKEKVRVDLSEINLENVAFQYENRKKNIVVAMNTDDLKASLSAIDNVYDIYAKGHTHIDSIFSGSWEMARAVDLGIDTYLTYNDSIKLVDIHEGRLNSKGKDFSLTGFYTFLNIPEIDLHSTAEDFNVESLIALLPEASTSSLREYMSESNLHFDLSLKGKWEGKKGPALSISFGAENATFRHAKTKMTLDEVDLNGELSMSDILNSRTGTLKLSPMQGTLSNAPFTSAVRWDNFSDPYINFSFDGDLDLASLLKFFPIEGIKSGRGTILANINFEGKPEELKYKKFIDRVKTSGELALNAIYIEFTDIAPGLRDLNGQLYFSNNDLAMTDVSGNFGRTDFLLNGYFKNVIAYLLFDNEPVGIEASLKSDFVDLDELLSLRDGRESQNYSFGISNRLRVLFDCEVDRLRFRRFHPSNIRGDLKIKNKIAFTDRLSFDNMGGRIQLSGMADASRYNYIRISTNFNLDHIAVDSIFYVFENFDQQFLVDKHLKGHIDATVDAEMMMSDRLDLYPETLRSHINASIKGGELNDFEPMQKLAPYLDESGLRHLRFSELANDIVIRDRTIYLPRMEIGSNVTDIVISGSHTFNQNIDYSIQAPLQSRKKYDTDEAFGAIQEDANGRAMLFLKIVGTTSDYYVHYDKESVKEKIASDLKKEATELKTIFKNKGKENRTVELTEDDYFDWEDDGN